MPQFISLASVEFNRPERWRERLGVPTIRLDGIRHDEVKCAVGDGKRPVVHCLEHSAELLAGWRELVYNSRRDLGVGGAGDQPVPFELAQPAGEGVGADAGQGARELTEPMRAFEELAHDQGGPGSVEEAQEARHAALIQGTVIKSHEKR